MGASFGTRLGVQLLVVAATAVTLSIAAAYVPILGVPASLLAPTPILLVALRHGLRMGLLALGLATVALSGLLGLQQGFLFCSEYGVMAMVMARSIQEQHSAEKTLLLASTVPLLVSGIVLGAFLWSAQPDLAAMRGQLEERLTQAMRLYLKGYENISDAQILQLTQDTLDLILRLLPALVLISSAAGALLNYSIARLLWHRVGGSPPFRGTSLAGWRAPDVCIWILIAGGILFFLPLSFLSSAGLNLLLLVGPLYMIQGVGIIVFYLRKGAVPVMFRWLAYLFFVIQPLLLLGVAALGLFDFWFDFRRLHHQKEEPR